MAARLTDEWAMVAAHIDPDFHFVLRLVCRASAAALPRATVSAPTKYVCANMHEWALRNGAVLCDAETLLTFVRENNSAMVRRLLPHVQREYLPTKRVDRLVEEMADDEMIDVLLQALPVSPHSICCARWRLRASSDPSAAPTAAPMGARMWGAWVRHVQPTKEQLSALGKRPADLAEYLYRFLHLDNLIPMLPDLEVHEPGGHVALVDVQAVWRSGRVALMHLCHEEYGIRPGAPAIRAMCAAGQLEMLLGAIDMMGGHAPIDEQAIALAMRGGHYLVASTLAAHVDGRPLAARPLEDYAAMVAMASLRDLDLMRARAANPSCSRTPTCGASSATARTMTTRRPRRSSVCTRTGWWSRTARPGARRGWPSTSTR